MDWTKRLKSFGITAVSLLGTVAVAVAVTPEWGNFLVQAHGWLLGLGVPATVVALVGVIIGEAWKQILNNMKISKASTIGAGREELDLY